MSGRKALCSVLASLFVLAGLPACVGSDPGDYVYYRVTQAARVSAFAVPDYDVSQTELDAHPGAVPFNIHLAVDPTVDTEGMVGGEPILASFGFRSSGAQYTHQVVGLSVDNPGRSYRRIWRLCRVD